MLIFYLIGINLKDLLYLKPSDLVDGRIRYGRYKTGGKYSIKVFPAAEEIINRYRGEKIPVKVYGPEGKDLSREEGGSSP